MVRKTDHALLLFPVTLADLYGRVDQFTESDTYRGTLGVKGDFVFAERDFFWETSFVYGRTETTNTHEDIFDIEFYLAVDAVRDENGNTVCRQQTLDAPESIATRNPRLRGIQNNLGLVPTQAQIDACVPLNLLGENAFSQEAANNVLFLPVGTQYYRTVLCSGSIGRATL